MHSYSQVIHRGDGWLRRGGTEVKSVPPLHKEKGRAYGLKFTVLIRFRVDGNLPNRKPREISYKRKPRS